MSVVRKVQSKIEIKKDKAAPLKEQEVSGQKERDVKKGSGKTETRSLREDTRQQASSVRPKKYCQFCRNNRLPNYWDAASLRRYLNDRGRIVARQRSGCCAKHQRRVSQEVKRARILALLPFTVKV